MFDDIGKILGEGLYRSAHRKDYCTKLGFTAISQSWMQNGYELKKIDVSKQLVRFEKIDYFSSGILIPPIFRSKTISDAAKYELENYFQYIIKKYGL